MQNQLSKCGRTCRGQQQKRSCASSENQDKILTTLQKLKAHRETVNKQSRQQSSSNVSQSTTTSADRRELLACVAGAAIFSLAPGEASAKQLKAGDLTDADVDRPCQSCKGLGYLPCVMCGGLGKWRALQRRFSKQSYDFVECPQCFGQGATQCLECFSTGMRRVDVLLRQPRLNLVITDMVQTQEEPAQIRQVIKETMAQLREDGTINQDYERDVIESFKDSFIRLNNMAKISGIV